PQDILDQLRLATQEAHDYIETVPLLQALREQKIDLLSYIGLLQKLFAFYHFLEKSLDSQIPAQAGVEDYAERMKHRLLRDDLVFLMGKLPASLPKVDLSLVLDTPAKFLGYLYVIEGSTLGGQLLSKSIKNHLYLEAGRGGSYYNSYGSKQIGYYWKKLKAYLMAYAEQHPAQTTELLNSARLTFQNLDQHLRR
ncbi:MAG: biliverdin-producing heme oxygenase, partial [Bacteroidota bacterium]